MTLTFQNYFKAKCYSYAISLRLNYYFQSFNLYLRDPSTSIIIHLKHFYLEASSHIREKLAQSRHGRGKSN